MTAAIYLAFEPEDAAAAEAIAAALEREGWSARRAAPDQRNADHGASLALAVSEAAAVLVLVSPAAEASEGIQREVSAALNNGRILIPVILADAPADSGLLPILDVDRQVAFNMQGVSAVVEAVRAAIQGGRVIAMLNIKGGVGKTILAANLFAAAHLIDKREISFVDLDPQHNLTQYFLPPGERHRVRAANQTIYSAFMAQGEASRAQADFSALAVPLSRAKQGKRAGFELVAGDERLFEFTLDTRSERDKADAFARFRAMISMLRTRSDAVIIDANPCATFLTRLAITAADHIVAPVRPETYSLTGLNMLEQVVRSVRGRPLRPGEFSVLLNGVNDRTRSDAGGDPDAATRAEISAAPFFGSALLEEAVPYSGALRATPDDRYAVNPINVTAMMRVGGRQVKEALARAAAAILRRAAP
jgi:cellulose biosynthesis protein BcsQ